MGCGARARRWRAARFGAGRRLGRFARVDELAAVARRFLDETRERTHFVAATADRGERRRIAPSTTPAMAATGRPTQRDIAAIAARVAAVAPPSMRKSDIHCALRRRAATGNGVVKRRDRTGRPLSPVSGTVMVICACRGLDAAVAWSRDR